MTDTTDKAPRTRQPTNASSRIFVVILAALAGSGGVLHGAAEIMQGNRPPVDILLKIGAFTVVPNYLLTGICAAFVGIAVVAWSATRIQEKWGPTVYLALSVVLALVGGGIALIPGSILAWAVATRIRKPLRWWKRTLSDRARILLTNMWLLSLIIGFGLFAVGFIIWSVALPPGEIREVTATHYACWSFLSSGTVFLFVAIICGFARDVERMEKKESPVSAMTP
jgi:hypothetical protein